MAKPPVDPTDVLAAAKEPQCVLAEMSTLALTATIDMNPPREILEMVKKEFARRLSVASAIELLTDDWLLNSNAETRGEIASEYAKRIDARPDGITLLYGTIPYEEERRDLLRVVFAKQKKHEHSNEMVWSRPVAVLFTAGDFARMYELETGKVNKCWLVGYYSQAPGARLDFLLKAYDDLGWYGQEESEQKVLEAIQTLLPTATDPELRKYVSDSLDDEELLALLVEECKKRNSIRPKDYLGWARRARSESQLKILQSGLEVCYASMPSHKLMAALQPFVFGNVPYDKHIRRGALLATIEKRLGEFDSGALEEIYNKDSTLREQVLLLYGRGSGDEQENKARLQKLLGWGDDRYQLNLIAFLAIGLGASAKEIEDLYRTHQGDLYSPDERAFVAYSGLPDSGGKTLLDWVRGKGVLMSKVQRVLVLRKDIATKEFPGLIDVNRAYSSEYNRNVFELYYSRHDADPKQMIDWYVKYDFVASETLAAVLQRFEVKCRDVVRAVEAMHKGIFASDFDKYAIDWFARHPEEIEPLLEKYTEGPVHEVLMRAYKQTDEYKKRVAEEAAR